MAKVIGLYNLEKKTAKTISTAYLAEGFSKLNLNVLTIDLNPNLGLTKFLKSEQNKIDLAFKPAILIENLGSHILKSRRTWDILSICLFENYKDLISEKNNVFFQQIFDPYDFVIIDFPAIDNESFDNMLNQVNSVIIPVQCEFYGLDLLEKTLLKILSNQDIIIEGILLSNHDVNNVLMPKFIENIKSKLEDMVFETIIARNYYLGLPYFNLENFTQTTNHFGFADYLKLANEIIEK